MKSCFPGDAVWPTFPELACSPRSGRRCSCLKVPVTAGWCQGWLRDCGLFFVCVFLSSFFFSFTFPAYSSPFSPSLFTFCPFLSRLPLVSHPFSSLLSSPNPLLLLGTPHFAGAPSQTEQDSYCLLRERWWNRFHNVIIPHMEERVLPEKLLDP